MAALAKTMTRVFFHDGTWSSFRGRTHGRPVDVLRVPATGSSAILQDHDQVGNRAAGDRIAASLSPDLLKVGAGLVLTAPFTPMLFMGEEWGALTPWQYFTDHHGRRAWPGRGRRTAIRVRPARLGPARCPIRRTRRPSSAPGWTGPSPTSSGTPTCSPGTGR